MKKIVALLSTRLVSFTAFTENTTNPDTICGLWLLPCEEGETPFIIEIYKENETYRGHLHAIEGDYTNLSTDILDENNPDPAQQNKPLLGLTILYKLKFKKDAWRNRQYFENKSIS